MKNIIIFLLLGVMAGTAGAAQDGPEVFVYQSLEAEARYQPRFVEGCHDPALDDSGWPTMALSALSENQHYCLRMVVELPERQYPLHTVLFSAMLASHTIYWDGERLAAKGRPGASRDTEVTAPIGHKIPMAPGQLTAGYHLLSMDVSTQHHSEDLYSIFYALMLVDNQRLVSNTQYDSIPPILLIGALLLLFVFFQLFFWIYHKDPAYLVFSFLCLSSGLLLALEFLKFFYAYPWDWHVYRLRLIIAVTFVTALLLPGYYLLYYRLSSLDRLGRVGQMRRWLLPLALVMVLLVLWIPSYDARSLALFTTSMVVTLAINALAWRRKLAGAAANGILLILGLVALALLPYSFVEKWFAAFFAVIALANLYSLMVRFGDARERALMSLRLETELLRRNLQPHFLMNSLMLIVEWIEVQPALAIKFVEALSDEFRLINNMSKQTLVNLDDEIALCRQHLEIMSYRYQKEFELTIEYPREYQQQSLSLPPAILHTLIENAFSHSQIQHKDNFVLTIVVEHDQCQLTMLTPYRPRGHQGTGTGQEYIRARLRESCGERWDLAGEAVGEQWRTRILLPLFLRDEEPGMSGPNGVVSC